MTDHLRYRTHQQHPVALVELAAVPATTGLSPLADMLRQHLAEQPGALVLDLAPLQAPAQALPLLREALAAVRACGDVPVVLHSPAAETRATASGAGLPEVVADRDEALRRAARYPVPRRHVLRDLPPDAHMLRTVRRAVNDACEAWGVAETTEPAQLVASELLSNAIEHAGTTADVLLALRDDQLHIVVRDGSRALPQRPSDPTPGDPRGRGLVLIDELAVAWAAVRTETGKLVWAILPAAGAGNGATASNTLAGGRR